MVRLVSRLTTYFQADKSWISSIFVVAECVCNRMNSIGCSEKNSQFQKLIFWIFSPKDIGGETSDLDLFPKDDYCTYYSIRD